MEYAVSEQDIKAVLESMGAITEEQRLESGVSAGAVMDLIEQVKEAVTGVVVPAGLLETLLTTAEQALWHREWTARDSNHPDPESVTRRLADTAKVRALLKKGARYSSVEFFVISDKVDQILACDQMCCVFRASLRYPCQLLIAD